ncbi:MAG: FkbM family methyltransferase [Burkholderiaceae bacterium]
MTTWKETMRRIDVGNLDPRDALLEAVAAYCDDPLFCIPSDAREVLAARGRATEIILLGATPFSRTFLSEAHDAVRIVAAVDDFRAASGDRFEGLPIITSQEMLRRAAGSGTITVSGCRYDRSRRYFKNMAREHRVPHLNFEQAMRLFKPGAARDHRVEDWGPTIAARLPEYLALGDRLVDDYSRDTLYRVLLSHLTCNPEWSLHAARPYCTLYFRSGLWSPGSSERFLDCGASLGESTSALIDAADGRFEQIWMVEPDRYNVETLQTFLRGFDGSTQRERISLHACAVGERDEAMPFAHQGGHGGQLLGGQDGDTVPVRRIDDLVDAAPTLIKMDIEGAELSALRGAAGCIAQAKPTLAISAYHRGNDLIDLSSFVLSLRPDYRIGLRHHTEERWDTCLYCY